MAINWLSDRADRATVTRLIARASGRGTQPDAGFSMVEMMVSLVVIAIVATASVTFFINNIRGVNNQRQHQEAVYLADQQLETVQSLPVAKLVKGRTQTEVTALYSTPAATAMKITTQDDFANSGNYDATATATGNETVPVTVTKTVNGVPYSLTTFIDVCWYTGSTGVCGPTQSAITTKEYRVSIYEAWTSPGECSNACSYTTSTIIDPNADPVFNTNLSAPTGTLTTPSNATVNADSGYTDSCTTSAGTSSGTLVKVTNGTNLSSGIRVRISSGGGSITEIAQPSATEVDFCLVAGDTPGTYTITVINTDGGHFQMPILEIANIAKATGWTPSTKTLTLYGGGIESGATVSATGATLGTYTAYNCATSTTAPCSTTGSLDEVVITNFSGPTNGGTATLTLTNPDSSTATYTIAAPTNGTWSASAVPVTQGKVISITGASNLAGAPNSLGVAITSGSGSASVVRGSASSATLTVTPTAIGTMTLYLYNDNGSTTSPVTLTVDPLPAVATATPNIVVAGQTRTVTVGGSGFISAGFTATAANGSVNVSSVSGTSVTLQVTASVVGSDVITFTNFDGGTTTFALTVHAPPAVTSVSPSAVLVGATKTVTLTGTGFVSAGFAIAANQGSISLISVSSTSVVVSVTPSSAGTDTITLQNADGGTTTYALTVDPLPTITSTSGAPVVAGQTKTVTISGTGFIAAGFSASANNGSVSVSSVTSTSVTLSVTPSSTGTDTITLTNADGGTVSTSLAVDAKPTISSSSGSPVVAGQAKTVTINGTGFVSAGFTASASNGSVSVSSVTSTTVTLSVTASTSGSDTITLTNADGGTVSTSLTVDAAPSVTNLAPTSFTRSNTTAVTFTITGTGFASGATVAFTYNGTAYAVSNVSVSGSTSVTFKATIPTSVAAGAHNAVATVTNSDGGVSNVFTKSITAN
jgi:prepilin-type N-terminal cleavage/methylation domain-containing protein